LQAAGYVVFAGGACPRYDPRVPDRLFFTEDESANRLLVQEPMALLIGFLLDQQVTVQKAFSGPLAIHERLGTLDAARLAEADLDAIFRERPAIHRFPGAMAAKVQELAATVRDEYGGDASRLWTEASDGDDLRRRIAALPGFGEMKIKSLGSVLYHRFGVEVAKELVPSHPTLGDVDSHDALAAYQAAKRLHKQEWLAARR
jgi:uncharacterized HhH-GPD family protein